MSNPLTPPAANALSQRLTRATGVLAGRLAQFLKTTLPGNGSSMAEGQAFLWAMFEAVAEGQSFESLQGTVLRPLSDGSLHPIDRLAGALRFSPLEIEILLLAGLSEEHEGYAAILRSLHPRSEARVSVGLAAQLYCGSSHERFAFRQLLETGAAVTSGALCLSGEVPFYERSLHLPESLWSVLQGIDVWPKSVTCLAVVITQAGLNEWFAQPQAQRAIAAMQRRQACTIFITADQEDLAFHRALALATHAGVEPAALLVQLTPDAGWENLLGLHALARGVTPVLKLSQGEGAISIEPPVFSTFPATCLVGGRSGVAGGRGDRPLLAVAVERLSPVARRAMWEETAPELAEQASFLAARYPVEPHVAAAVAADAYFVAMMERRQPVVEDVADSLRIRGSITLSAGVKLMRPQATWNDLVLPEDRLKQLREAVARLEMQSRVFDEWGFLAGRQGARGVRMLFVGPPGTGKTLSAEVIAHTLQVELLIVDLSRVVSKWIGETEKNLAAVFDVAERAQSALFFDEADALFGKRTEVTDAHDRYANLETAYLLTRLEQFDGIAILATNLRQNIDPAFLRRLEFVVEFNEPGREERLALWRGHLPSAAPLAPDVNLSELADMYPLVGGVIRNAAVAAGFLAATETVPISNHHLVQAIRREYEKAGRAFPGLPISLRR